MIVEISKKEIKQYEGPVFYLTHHEVKKPDSVSTPIEVNSSLKYKGISFKYITMKGLNSLQELYGVQLKFREHRIALVCDISKMYHSIYTTDSEYNSLGVENSLARNEYIHITCYLWISTINTR